MQYIKLEDVQKILLDYRNDIIYSITDACDKINSLPSIDFEEMILQLKRKNKKSSRNKINMTPQEIKEQITNIRIIDKNCGIVEFDIDKLCIFLSNNIGKQKY